MHELYSQALAMADQLRAFQADLHRHPELSLQERRTTAQIRSELDQLGLDYIPMNTETGVAALLTGAHDGPLLLLRADIDAIAQQEVAEHSPRSENDGVMHACGHDVHTTCLLGAAKLLAARRADLHGSVLFLFQPAEEIVEGARMVLNGGLLDRLPRRPDACFALHTRPELPCGQIAVIDGPIMAGKTNFRITLTGRSGHGGSPHKCVDPIVAGGTLIGALQTMVSRNTDPLDSLVCSLCSVHTDAPDFFVPDSLTISGSLRWYREDTHIMALRRLQEITEGVAAAYGCTSQIEREEMAPATINHASLVPMARHAAEAVVGPEGVVSPAPDMGGEDFALFGREAPSLLYWLGTGIAGQPLAPWHSAGFQVDPNALPIGAALLAQTVLTVQQEWTK